LKEQVITPRMSARRAPAGKGRGGVIVQKPARRDRPATGGGNGRARSNGALRKALVYLPLVGKIMLAALVGVLLFAGYRAAASAAFFQARAVDINQTTHASHDEIEAVVRREAERLGVWRVDLASLSAELEQLAWVRQAVVSRVLPDGLRVRVTERSPLAVVRTAKGSFIWVDDDAVTLGAMLATTDRQPTFFIRGWDESGKPEARAANRARIQKYLELTREWDAAGLSERISEVDLANVRDVSVQLTGDDAQVKVRLGNKDFGNRLRNALKALDENHNTPGAPSIALIQTFDNRTIMGKSDAETEGENTEESHAPTGADNGVTTAPPKPAAEPPDAARRNKRSASDISKKEQAQRDKKQQARKEQAKKEESKTRAKGETRPRRIG
jgi:cell division protein FtsQ